MSTINDSDLFLVNRGGVSYKLTAANFDTMQDTDQILIQRGGVNYRVPYGDISKLQDTDLLLIERSGVSYKVTWADVQGLVVYNISNSLMFTGGDYLRMSNPVTANNVFIGSWDGTHPGSVSVWLKLGTNVPITGNNPAMQIIEGEYADGQRYGPRLINQKWCVVGAAGGGLNRWINSQGLAFDYAGWYHYHATASDNGGWIFHINGVYQGQITTNSWPNATDAIIPCDNGPTWGYSIGRSYLNNDSYFYGYMAEMHVLQTNTSYTQFGEFNDKGVWVPIEYKGDTASYGTVGWYLKFDDPSNIGKDSSGNGNDFQPNGFDTSNTADQDYAPMADGPTSNYALLDPESAYAMTFTQSNKSSWTSTFTGYNSFGTIGPLSGRYYFEVTVGSLPDTMYVGLYKSLNKSGYQMATANPLELVVLNNANNPSYQYNGTGGTLTSNGLVFAQGDVVGVSVDVSAGTINWQTNGTGPIGTLTGGSFAGWRPGFSGGGAPSVTWAINFGQRPFLHQPSGFPSLDAANLPAKTIAKGSDHFQVLSTGNQAGNFFTFAQGASTDPTSGFQDTTIQNFATDSAGVPSSLYAFDDSQSLVSSSYGQGVIYRPDTALQNVTKIRWYLNQGNITTSNIRMGYNAVDGDVNATVTSTAVNGWNTIYDGAATTINNIWVDGNYVGGVYSGYSTSCGSIEVTIGGVASNITTVDSLTAAKTLFPNSFTMLKTWVDANAQGHQWQIAFKGSGSNQVMQCPNTTGLQDYVADDVYEGSRAYCWNTPDSFTPGTTGGFTGASGYRNVAAGISKVSVSCNSTEISTYEHGLGKELDMVWCFNETSTTDRAAYMPGLEEYLGALPLQYGVKLNLVNGYSTMGTAGAGAVWQSNNSTSFGVGPTLQTATTGNNYTFINFTSVPGYSAFGYYIPVGGNSCTQIDVGFRPKLVIIKNLSASRNWLFYDAPGNQFNQVGQYLGTNVTSNYIPFLAFMATSRGFRIESPDGTVGNLSWTYSYACFAENPFGGSNVASLPAAMGMGG